MRITADELACVRGEREIFRGLTFAIGSGETLAITGPNGAGKSSLLRVLAGLIRPTQGQITLQGGQGELTIAEQAHYLGHHDALKPSLTVAENLAFWSDFFRGRMQSSALLCQVGLDRLAHVPVGYLSAGQRRRLALARLLAIELPIWLLDEPSASLDAEACKLLAAMMGAHTAKGGLIALATHAPIGSSSMKEVTEIRLGPLFPCGGGEPP